jgi:hypothetical protein
MTAAREDDFGTGQADPITLKALALQELLIEVIRSP